MRWELGGLLLGKREADDSKTWMSGVRLVGDWPGAAWLKALISGHYPKACLVPGTYQVGRNVY